MIFTFKMLCFTFKFVIITVIAVNAVAFATAMLVTQNIKGKNLFRSISLCLIW